MSGRLVVLSGPSGVGKDEVLCAWRSLNPLVKRVVSVTTRTRVSREVDGIDYHFVDEPTFLRMIDEGELLEHEVVFGSYYGTPRTAMGGALAAGLVTVLKIDVKGALKVMSQRPDALNVFLLPPSWEELERRIRSRGRDTEEQIQRRLETALWELDQRDRYAYHVVNETGQVLATARKIQSLLTGPS